MKGCSAQDDPGRSRMCLAGLAERTQKSPGALLLRGLVCHLRWHRTRRKPGRPMPVLTNARTLTHIFARNKGFIYSLFLSIVRPASTRSASPCLLTPSVRAIFTGSPACT